MIRPHEIKGVPPPASPVAWHVSYNNAEPFTVEATTEREATDRALIALGIERAVHPLRVWPKQQESL